MMWGCWSWCSAVLSEFYWVKELGFLFDRGNVDFGFGILFIGLSRNVEEDGDGNSEKIVEVLMINSTSGPGLLFPKGGWENDETAEEAAVREAMEEAGVRGDLVHFLGCYPFKSKTLQDEYSPEGLCRAAMYALHVKEELDSWPEKSCRERSWLTVREAIESCRHAWMRDALEKGFSNWFADVLAFALED
ncbi:Nudix hydrolase 16, mitochondrial [Sesamum angolense]|uniref:Nudix hydrolase 16, mitochondrial n=1 Tax=Sesamum angolense TaxID=2727404 RepID=A0AAE2BP77_9LAMI|nr:Nudix hydrolase 16, mitochondrial [Sesamum angolense]